MLCVVAPFMLFGLRMARFQRRGESGVSWATMIKPFAIGQFAVLYLAFVAFDLQPHLETERIAQPLDGGDGILIHHRAGHARPIARGWLHIEPPNQILTDIKNIKLSLTNANDLIRCRD